jgi:GH15 family glucan-1,4-alpha-glucosidase
MDEDTRRFLIACADAAAEQWTLEDQGIWEIRGEPRHFVYSKVMCWVALDRAIDLADRLGAGERAAEWARVRQEIRRTVLDQGWSEEAGAFTQSFGSTALDASSLAMSLVGFLPPQDHRVVATVEAIARDLVDSRGLVRRYRTGEGVDGLTGEEGSFLLCTFWLAQALAEADEVDRATEVFERAISCCNDVGLLGEEVETATGELVGNFPQAFSHVGLINTALNLSRASGPAKERATSTADA